jgi:hypothetical protein
MVSILFIFGPALKSAPPAEETSLLLFVATQQAHSTPAQQAFMPFDSKNIGTKAMPEAPS